MHTSIPLSLVKKEHPYTFGRYRSSSGTLILSTLSRLYMKYLEKPRPTQYVRSSGTMGGIMPFSPLKQACTVVLAPRWDLVTHDSSNAKPTILQATSSENLSHLSHPIMADDQHQFYTHPVRTLQFPKRLHRNLKKWWKSKAELRALKKWWKSKAEL